MKKLKRNVAVYAANASVSYADALHKVLADIPGARADIFPTDAKLDKVFNVKNYGLVIVAGIQNVPGTLKSEICRYLADGGRVLTLGGPAFELSTYNFNGDWVSQNEFLARAIENVDDKKKFRIFDAADPAILDTLRRSSNTMDRPVTKTVDSKKRYNRKRNARDRYDDYGASVLIILV